MNIYYAYFYSINNGFPKLLQELPIKAYSMDVAWDKVTKIAFGDEEQETKMMVRMIKEENPF